MSFTNLVFILSVLDARYYVVLGVPRGGNVPAVGAGMLPSGTPHIRNETCIRHTYLISASCDHVDTSGGRSLASLSRVGREAPQVGVAHDTIF
jgi:hypothetical protein